jgi:hypothetical protein
MHSTYPHQCPSDGVAACPLCPFLQFKKKLPPSTTSINDLPFDLLVIILQHVDGDDRLRSCSLVSSTWTRATHVSIGFINETVIIGPDMWRWEGSTELPGMRQWLSKYDGSCYLSQLSLTFHR